MKKGFSLLELLIYVAIVSVVILAIIEIFFYVTRGRGNTEARAEVHSNLRFAIEKMSQDVRSASAVAIPAAAGNSASSIEMTIAGSAVTYCVVTGQLRRGTGGSCDGSSEIITNNNVFIDSLNSTRLENTNTVLSKTVVSLEIILDARYNSASPDWQYSSRKKTTISLR